MKVNAWQAVTGVAALSLTMSVCAATLQSGKEGLLNNFDRDGIVDLGGNPYSDMLALSQSGDIAVGFIATPANNNQAGAWSLKQGLIALPIPFAQTEGLSNAQSVSGDGKYIVGYVMPENSALMQGVLWTDTNKLTYLMPLATGADYYANAISTDGKVIVGTASNQNNYERAVYWDRVANTIHDLGSLSNSVEQESQAVAVNGDGSVIVGSSVNPAGIQQAFRWTAQTGMVELPSLAGASQAMGVSDSGRIIGYSTNAKNESRAVYWLNQTIKDLGTLRADNSGSSFAQAVSLNGKVIVGSADNEKQRIGFIWKEGTGRMYSVNDWLKYANVKADGMSVKSVNAISANSQTIAGQLTNGHGYVAHLIELSEPAEVNPSNPKPVPPKPEQPKPVPPKPVPPKPEPPKPVRPKPEPPKPVRPKPVDHHVIQPNNHASGIVETRQVVSSLYFVQRNLEVQRQLLDVAASQADCASFGVDGMCVKVQADLRFRDSEVAYRAPAAGLTVAYQFYPQWRLGLSATAADMHIKDANGSRIRQLAPVFTLFTGYGNAGEPGWKGYAGVTLLNAGMDIERAYHNGSLRETGIGHTRTHAYEFTLRSGYTFTPYSHMQITPYVALGYHALRWGGYDETDRSVFAAHFDGLRSKVTSASLGIATQWQVSARSSLGLDVRAEKNLKQQNSRAVASVLGGFGGLGSQYQVPNVDDVMPRATVSYTFSADENQAVSVAVGYQDIGFGSGEGNVGLTYRIAF